MSTGTAATENAYATAGKVIAVKDGLVVFVPRGSNYELHLKTQGQYAGPVGSPVRAILRATARKVWTVPSGGNFVVPIVGPTRIIQGRVKAADAKLIVVHAGATFVVALPSADSAIDLPNGPIAVGTMVNVTALPGASWERVD
ncbi:MAG: hypothetical protein ABIP55_07840 [Tepidisphaeraceae bacterium]